MSYIHWLFTKILESVWVLWVTFIWSGVNTTLTFFFSDLSPGECFPAPAISGGEFHHPHTCTVHRISWSFLPRKGKTVFMAFMWHRLIPWSWSLRRWNVFFPSFIKYFQWSQETLTFTFLMWGTQFLISAYNIILSVTCIFKEVCTGWIGLICCKV